MAPAENTNDGRVLLAVDGNSLLHRAFHAYAATGTRSRDGRGIWAVRGLVGQLVAAVERIGPDAVVIGFDDSTHSRRRDTWPQYKATRVEKLEALVEQLALAIEILREMGVAVVVPAGLEADDVLASAARFAPTVGARTVIMTSDRDAFSLIDEHTRVLRIINGGVEASPLLNAQRLEQMLGIRPDQYRDYAAMRGDASDNLTGVHGIGPKTAAKLLASLGSAQAAFDDIAGGGAAVVAAVGPGAARRLEDPGARIAWELNCAVMTMHTDLDLGLDLGGGRGCLPLESAAMQRAFAPHQPVWSIVDAVRVLADVGAGEGPDSQLRAHRDAVISEPAGPQPTTTGRGWAPRRLPPLPAKIDQLSLFD
jgi:5'-3' exonuclease